METNINEYKPLRIRDIIKVLWKNRWLIAVFLLIGLLWGLLLSAAKHAQKPQTYRYQAVARVELTSENDMGNQAKIVQYLMESEPVHRVAKEDAKITSGDYKVWTKASSIPDQYEVFVEGPDAAKVIQLADKIIVQTHGMVNISMEMETNEILEYAVPYGEPIASEKSISLIPNLVVSMIFAGLLSVAYIYGVRYFRGSVYSSDELKQILKTDLIVDKSQKIKPHSLANIFGVR